MFKRYVSILMMFFAVAILLAHDIVPHHHHHDFKRPTSSHHHSDEHSHDDGDKKGASETTDFGHLFSHLQHADYGVTFLSSIHFTNVPTKQLSQEVAEIVECIIFQQAPILRKDSGPPPLTIYYRSPCLLLKALRAPPSFNA